MDFNATVVAGKMFLRLAGAKHAPFGLRCRVFLDACCPATGSSGDGDLFADSVLLRGKGPIDRLIPALQCTMTPEQRWADSFVVEQRFILADALEVIEAQGEFFLTIDLR